MKKFAALLMLVCSLGVFAVVGCGPDAKTPAAPAKTGDKMESADKGKVETPPATPPAAPEKGK